MLTDNVGLMSVLTLRVGVQPAIATTAAPATDRGMNARMAIMSDFNRSERSPSGPPGVLAMAAGPHPSINAPAAQRLTGRTLLQAPSVSPGKLMATEL